MVWEEIGNDLLKDGSAKKCLCWGGNFCDYLKRKLNLSLEIKLFRKDSPLPSRAGSYDLIIAWEVIPGDDDGTRLDSFYRLLKKGGEARVYGFYLHPTADDVVFWERKYRQASRGDSMDLPLPGAVSLTEITAQVGSTPFEHYVIRKHGIYYQALLIK